jgi:hypothetical protein
MASIEQNGTWKLVNLPHGHRPIGLKWVFKVKRDEASAIVKHKARLVAKGYVQQEGVDFDEVFAPVARMESIQMLLAVAAQEGWLVHHMDVIRHSLMESCRRRFMSDNSQVLSLQGTKARC